MSEAPRILLGQAVGAHGLRGEIRVRYFGDGPENLLRQTVVWLEDEGVAGDAKRLEVVSAGTGRAGEVRLKLSGVEERDAAEAFKRNMVLGSVLQLEPLEDGEFYWHQVVGCQAESKEGRIIGTVREIWETGAHDVLVVETEEGVRHLISAAREIVTLIDPDAGRIVVDTLPGMLDQGLS